ncbi:pentapeptide repeat-containing protein [Leptothoe spongobia]|uniref:Pentapeptide repeat-containing protein n=1 Tax=Leptothoe spongobia TAU-MAC 1115 TaxID=1967444 RepID=A0A947DCL1_9CYAN|nr:pentapeptide repeat-containing protein [Leptothoe spongobia]MBT9314029.1 pentapeptide repeat-containing protein [Leptothoe spongobia TAU-MAC 1115]
MSRLLCKVWPELGNLPFSPYVLIFDGWDEISTGSTQGFKDAIDQVLNEIRSQFIDQRRGKPAMRVILTGRPSVDVTSGEDGAYFANFCARINAAGGRPEGSFPNKILAKSSFFQAVNLRESDLRGADLRESDLYGADLRGVDLRESDLCGADLSESDLREVKGLVLRQAKLARNWNEARYDEAFSQELQLAQNSETTSSDHK